MDDMGERGSGHWKPADPSAGRNGARYGDVKGAICCTPGRSDGGPRAAVSFVRVLE